MKQIKIKRVPLLIIFVAGISFILVSTVFILNVVTEESIRDFEKSMVSSYNKDFVKGASILISSNTEEMAKRYSYIFDEADNCAKVLSESSSSCFGYKDTGYLLKECNYAPCSPEEYYSWGNLPTSLSDKDLSALSHIKDHMKMLQESNSYSDNTWVNLIKLQVVLTFPDYSTDLKRIDQKKLQEYFAGQRPKYEYYGSLAKNKPTWTGLSKQMIGTDKIVSVFYPIFDRDETFIGLAGVDLNITNVIRDAFSLQNNDIAGACYKYSFLLSGDLSIIYTSEYLEKFLCLPKEVYNLDTDNFNYDFKTKFSDSSNKSVINIVDKLKDKKEGIFFQSINDTYCVIAFSRINSNNWIVGVVLPLKILTKSLDDANKGMENTLKKLTDTYLLISIILLLVTIVLSVLFFRHFVLSPIRSVMDAIRKIGKGDFNVDFKIRGIMEIALLAHGVKKMGKELVEYTENLTKEVKARHMIETEVEIASEIQKSILPKLTSEFIREEFDINAKIVPASGNISGDFYDFFYLDTNTLVLVIGDVSGKGIGAAFFMNMAKVVIKNVCMQNSSASPGAVLTGVNGILSSNNEASMFLTMYLCFYDIHTGILTYANAGHHEILKVSESGESVFFGSAGNMMIGLYSDAVYKDKQTKIEKGDMVVFFTDGVSEALNSDDVPFGEERLSIEVKRNREKKCSELNEIIISNVISFESGRRFDDITLLSFKRLK